MLKHLRPRALVVLLAVAALAAGYALPRPGRGGDMLDAVAAIQRHSPRFLISEPPVPAPASWARTGPAIYLCSTLRAAEEVDSLSKHPGKPDPRWGGIVCFRATLDEHAYYHPWVSEGGDRCLHFGTFAVYGDREALQEVRAILVSEGFKPASGRPSLRLFGLTRGG